MAIAATGAGAGSSTTRTENDAMAFPGTRLLLLTFGITAAAMPSKTRAFRATGHEIQAGVDHALGAVR
jgi:hypothetical protein